MIAVPTVRGCPKGQFPASFGHGRLFRCARFGPGLNLRFNSTRPSLPDVAATQEGGWSAVNQLNTSGAATSLVLEPWAGERCAAAPVQTVPGTDMPFGTYEGAPSVSTLDRTRPSFAGIGAHVGALVTGMGADQVKATVRIPAAANGIPPRRTPPRC